MAKSTQVLLITSVIFITLCSYSLIITYRPYANEILLDHCKCKRYLPSTPTSNEAHFYYFNQTTCSKDAYQRGNGQKIVGYSFYQFSKERSKKKKYFEGILANVKLIRDYYPGWIMRIYTDFDKPELAPLCEVACDNPHLDLCLVKDLPGTPFKDASRVFPMNWRFFATIDPQVYTRAQ